jgi:AraC-like DNA-binding protein
VANLIADRPYLPFSVNELAAASRMTRNHFSTLFHSHVGKSFSNYLAEKRMDLAMELLRDPRVNIGEVARRSGYEDPGYFARRFRQSTGLSPRDWRQLQVRSPDVPDA